MSDATLIEHGRIVDPAGGVDRVGRLLIDGGVIAAIDPRDDDVPADVTRFDARGQIVAPGLVDLGTELREPGFEEDETIATASAAAVAGGYTSLVCSANTDPCIDTPGAVEFVRQKAARTADVRVHVAACVSKDRAGDQMAELSLLADAGAVAFSDAPRPITNDALMKRALEYCLMLDRVILHRPGIPELSAGGVMHAGRVSLTLGLRGIPTEAEDLAVARDTRMAEGTGGRLHVGPVSTMGAIDLITRVKSRGVAITASVAPHNLAMTDEELRTFESRYKVHPPLRSSRHVEAIRGALAEGIIDVVQSGHMPRSREKKMDDLDLAPFGGSSLETALATTVTFWGGGRPDWPAVIDRMSTAPARVIGLDSRTLADGTPLGAGTLNPGTAADVIVVDPDASGEVDPADSRSRCDSTPLAGRTLRSAVIATWVGGRRC